MKILQVIIAVFVLNPIFAQVKTYDTLPNLPDHYTNRCKLFESEPIVKGKIIMVGNSITEGGNWKTLLQDSAVINRGISGDVTFGVLNRIRDIADRQPSKLFLLIGVNDLSRNTPDDLIIENILMIITRIRVSSPNTEIYLQSILPTNDNFKNLFKAFIGKGAHIRKINEELKKYGSVLKYTYVDLYSNFQDADGNMDARYSSDGLHLNQAGYSHWVEVLKNGKYL